MWIIAHYSTRIETAIIVCYTVIVDTVSVHSATEHGRVYQRDIILRRLVINRNGIDLIAIV